MVWTRGNTETELVSGGHHTFLISQKRTLDFTKTFSVRRKMQAPITSLLLCLCACATLQFTTACSCGRAPTLKDAFCKKGDFGGRFLIQARVVAVEWLLPAEPIVSEPSVPYDFFRQGKQFRYTLKVIETYRDDDNVVTPTSYMEANTQGSLCGVELQIAKTYVFAGSGDRNAKGEATLGTGLCSYHRMYDEPTPILMPKDCSILSYMVAKPDLVL